MPAGKELAMSSAIYIENLPSHEGRAELERLLMKYGAVRQAILATDPDMMRRHAGLAVVEMGSEREANAAIRGLDGAEYQGCTLRVRPALPCDGGRLQSMCQWPLPVREKLWRAACGGTSRSVRHRAKAEGAGKRRAGHP
jgi:RNA recognition motif-containing protein